MLIYSDQQVLHTHSLPHTRNGKRELGRVLLYLSGVSFDLKNKRREEKSGAAFLKCSSFECGNDARCCGSHLASPRRKLRMIAQKGSILQGLNGTNKE